MDRVWKYIPLFVFVSLSLLLEAGCGDDTLLQPGSGNGTVFINGYPDQPSCPWQLTMPGGLVLHGLGDSTLVDMPEGGYSISWGSVDEFHPPNPNPYQQWLHYPLAITFTGIYTPVEYHYPHVPWVEAGHAGTPGQVEVRWLWYLSNEHPTDHYEIACRFDGPVTTENFESSPVLKNTTHQSNLIRYTEVLDPADGLIPGMELWIGVRAVDADGWTTHIVESPRLVVSSAWWAQGVVHDHQGEPLVGVIILCDQDAGPVISQADGSYLLGPLVDQLPITFSADASQVVPFSGTSRWFDFEGTPQEFAGVTHYDFVMIPAFELDPECHSYNGDFLEFFRNLTKTDAPGLYRQNQEFSSWSQYPVKVFVPEFVRDDNVDFGAASRYGIDIWNQALGAQILVADGVTEAEADVVFYFDNLGGLANGVTSLAEPLGFTSHLGYIIPERINVGINNVILPNLQRVRETALHEMGHALGIYRHVQGCTQAGYLMSLTSAGCLDEGNENAIHEDEIRAMNLIYRLPRWMDMAGFH